MWIKQRICGIVKRHTRGAGRRDGEETRQRQTDGIFCSDVVRSERGDRGGGWRRDGVLNRHNCTRKRNRREEQRKKQRDGYLVHCEDWK